jgi:hypothetical protein
MSDENLIRKYAAGLRQMEMLDRDYYANRRPSAVQRAAYERRKERAEEMRTRFYAALEANRSGEGQLWQIGADREVVTCSLARRISTVRVPGQRRRATE